MRLVEVAMFNFPNDAAVLESVLAAENIEYFLNHTDTAIIVPGSGVSISVSEADLPRTMQVIREAGFEKYLVV